MRCPFCSNEDTQVKDSRPTEDNSAIRRRRSCAGCGARFTTFERVQLRELTVTKKNGKRTAFVREKMERSIKLALSKRPVEEDKIDRMINGIVRQLESRGENDIPTDVIGKLIMEVLEHLDTVAYVRFASVYRDFTVAEDFKEFVGKITELQDEK